MFTCPNCEAAFNRREALLMHFEVCHECCFEAVRAVMLSGMVGRVFPRLTERTSVEDKSNDIER